MDGWLDGWMDGWIGEKEKWFVREVIYEKEV
jgi:hypothetical protein